MSESTALNTLFDKGDSYQQALKNKTKLHVPEGTFTSKYFEVRYIYYAIVLPEGIILHVPGRYAVYD